MPKNEDIFFDPEAETIEEEAQKYFSPEEIQNSLLALDTNNEALLLNRPPNVFFPIGLKKEDIESNNTENLDHSSIKKESAEKKDIIELPNETRDSVNTERMNTEQSKVGKANATLNFTEIFDDDDLFESETEDENSEDNEDEDDNYTGEAEDNKSLRAESGGSIELDNDTIFTSLDNLRITEM